MLKIAICDSDRCTCSEIEFICNKFALENHNKFEIEIYFSGETLQRALSEGTYYDILLLDIELVTSNGLNIGMYIRDYLENETSFIIYTTVKNCYSLDLFKTRPLDLIIKPITECHIVHDLKTAIRLITKNKPYFEFCNAGTFFKIMFNDIIYFQSVGKKIVIVLEEENKQFYGKLSQVMEEIDKDNFLLIHKSYLINYMFIKEYTYEWVKMVDGKVLNISKSNRANVRKKVLERRHGKLIEGL